MFEASRRRHPRDASMVTRSRCSTSIQSTSRVPATGSHPNTCVNRYTSFGYEPEYQWFAARGALGGQTANVVATLKGTINPELVYVVSSHYDSVAAGPGADDDSSGTAALLEA